MGDASRDHLAPRVPVELRACACARSRGWIELAPPAGAQSEPGAVAGPRLARHEWSAVRACVAALEPTDALGVTARMADLALALALAAAVIVARTFALAPHPCPLPPRPTPTASSTPRPSPSPEQACMAGSLARRLLRASRPVERRPGLARARAVRTVRCARRGARAHGATVRQDMRIPQALGLKLEDSTARRPHHLRAKLLGCEL